MNTLVSRGVRNPEVLLYIVEHITDTNQSLPQKIDKIKMIFNLIYIRQKPGQVMSKTKANELHLNFSIPLVTIELFVNTCAEASEIDKKRALLNTKASNSY